MVLETLVGAALWQSAVTVRRMRDAEMYSITPNAHLMTWQNVPSPILPAVSVSDLIAADIGSITGVAAVSPVRQGDVFTVEVMLDRFEFEVRRKVYSKELELYEAFPEYEFEFRVMPCQSAEFHAGRA